jgi:hypothetical protein
VSGLDRVRPVRPLSRQTLTTHAGGDVDIDTLVDTFFDVARHEGLKGISRAEAVPELNALPTRSDQNQRPAGFPLNIGQPPSLSRFAD